MVVVCYLAVFWDLSAKANRNVTSISDQFDLNNAQAQQPDSIPGEDEEDIDLPYPFEDETGNPFLDQQEESPLHLRKPSNIQSDVIYDPETGEYQFVEKIGDMHYRTPYSMSLQEYNEYRLQQEKRNYWQEKAQTSDLEENQSFVPSFNIKGEAFDKVFGSNTINITPQGSAEVIFGFTMNRIDNPTIPERLRRTPSFTFEEKIQMNVSGSIGDKLELGINYNTEATFDFENKTKLEYSGDEDEIIQKIEAGNVSLPLTGSLITGSQSLFGLKTELQFGKLTMTSVFSHQKGESSVIEVQGGAQVSEFEVSAGDYDANRHFFLGHHFGGERYNRAMRNLPVIQSNIQIEEIEVWITNKTRNQDGARNIIALADLGEYEEERLTNTDVVQINNPNGSQPFPSNQSNNLYDQVSGLNRDIGDITTALENLGLTSGRDFEKIELARKLDPREYTLNRELGYISLNTALNADEVLAVAYRYKLAGTDNYQKVGELTNNAPSDPATIFVKLLKGTTLSPQFKTWDLMMKNIYAIGAYQVNKEDFMLNVLYQDDTKGQAVNYIPTSETSDSILLRVTGLDRLNIQSEPYADGMFDYLPGLTIYPSNGRIIFPTVEPFGESMFTYLKHKYGYPDNMQLEQMPDSLQQFVFDALYDSTKTNALQIAERNKYLIAGEYKSASGSEIQLNALNVPRGSVVVTAGGIKLTENVDYTVDYTLGRVKILNQAILESGQPVRISLESNSLFNIQTKTLVGTHLNYKFSDDFYLGGTILNLTERPLTKKVNFGDEPISNTIWGLNGSYRTESPFITSLVDKIPFIDTKEKSTIQLDGEFAHLIPGSSKAIGKNGVAYLDDFEGSETAIDMKSFPAWVLASTPQGQNDKFPEAMETNNLAYGFNRSKFAWYVIDDIFQQNTSFTPDHIKSDDDARSRHMVREIFEQEIFPNREREHNIPSRIAVLNLAYYPDERGPYNYSVDNIAPDGRLLQPEKRWGGVMREVLTSDFEAANIEFIEFWMMDPFADDTGAYENPEYLGEDPAIYFNLGNISEDILKDSRKSFEDGLPISEDDPNVSLDTTSWGLVSRSQNYVNSFANSPDARPFQDVGLDGLRNEEEINFFDTVFIDKLNALVSQGELDQDAYEAVLADPSSDNFHYYRGSDYDQQELGILERYKNYNGHENNSRTADNPIEPYPTTGKNSPDVEDINRDNTLSEGESYYQYKISLRPEHLEEVGDNYITDIVDYNATFENGEKSKVRWLQFKIPLEEFERAVGNIQDFKSIRFMRMFLHGAKRDVFLRFATLDLVRSEWRKYNLPLYETIEQVTGNTEDGKLDISAVNIEENANKKPVNYVLPPGFDREIDPSNPQIRQLNEQSMVLKVTNLEDGDARAAYKNTSLDMRQYKKLKMEIHAEELIDDPTLEDGDLTVFVRLGSDYVNNFYEYEVPLKLTPPGKYNNGNDEHRLTVWPEENRIDIDLNLFTDAKLARNDDRRRTGSNVSFNTVYEYMDGDKRVIIRGNPNLSNVRTIMIGVRNPKRANYLNPTNDGYPKSGEIWVNELRLTDFKDRGGWAANARMRTNLADFGSVSAAVATSTPGFGSIEQKVNERDQENLLQYDIATNLELGKFFPEKAGVSIPMYYGVSERFINPEYNPLEPDVKLKESIQNAETQEEVDEIKDIAQDYTKRQSLNFTNVKINKSSGEPKIYDISNFAVSYSYSEIFHRDINTEYNKDLTYRAAFSYNYNKRPQSVTPFRNAQVFNSPYLRLIKDFNFYYLPSRLSFRTDLNRLYSENKIRNLNNPDITIPETVFKDYTWNRYYDVKFDLTKSLKLDFSATSMSRFDEANESFDDFGIGFKYDPNPDLEGRHPLGRTLNYRHNIRASYSVPINKLPPFDWMNVTTQYDANYQWQTGPQKLSGNVEAERLGNTISNSYSWSINSSNRLNSLYNKIGFIKRINAKYGGRGRQEPVEYKTVTYERPRTFFREGAAKSITHKLKTEDVTVTVYNEDGQEVPSEVDVINENRVRVTVAQDIRGASVTVQGQVEKKENPLIFIGEQLVRIGTGFKDISVSYRETQGTVLPGYLNETSFLGMDNVNGAMAPGIKFILGLQQGDLDFVSRAQGKDWLTGNEFQLSPVSRNKSKNLEIRSTFEPFEGFRVNLNANRSITEVKSLNYDLVNRLEDFSNNPDAPDPYIQSGSFSISWITWRTAFERTNVEDGYKSKAFNDLKENRRIISQRRAIAFEEKYGEELLQDSEGYHLGYGPTSKQVLLPSFLAAYTGVSANDITLNRTPSVPLPNWRITFDGLSNIEFVKQYLRSINITHSYRSRYSIGSLATNLDYEFDGLPNTDIQNNFMSDLEVNSVTIEEQLSPLIGIDMNWLNSLTTRFEIKKSRSLGLNFANNQLLDLTNHELVIGAGYSIRDVELVINAGSGQQAYESDLNIRADLSIRDTKTLVRRLQETQQGDPTEATAGERRFTIKTTMDYALSDSFTVSFFFDRVLNEPVRSDSYTFANTNIGFSVRFTLIQ